MIDEAEHERRLQEAERRSEKYGEMTFIRHLHAKIAMRALRFVKPWIVDACLATGDDNEPLDTFNDLIDEALTEAGIKYETINALDSSIVKVRILEDA